MSSQLIDTRGAPTLKSFMISLEVTPQEAVGGCESGGDIEQDSCAACIMLELEHIILHLRKD